MTQRPVRIPESIPEPGRPGLQRSARALGWISIGLGAGELIWAGRLVAMFGGRRRGVTRFYGVREIVTGIGILNARDPAPWLWGRVAGDALDLLSLANGFNRSPGKIRRLMTLVSVAGITAVDVATARRMGQVARPGSPSMRFARAR